MHDANLPVNCYFCHQEIPEEKIEILSPSDGIPLLRTCWCPYCVANDDIVTVTIVRGRTDVITSAHLYYNNGDHHYRLMFHLAGQTFTIYYKNEINAGDNPIYWVAHIPDINPKNVRQRLPTLLTFL